MSRLAGREVEIAAIDLAVTDVRSGHGRLILVTGEPGVGKTRLAEEAIKRAESAGLLTARGYALDDPGVPPLWPWRRACGEIEGVGQILAGSADIGSDAAARFGLFEAVGAAIGTAADGHGIAMLLEDMHWADPPSIQLVRHLMSDLSTRRILLILTARDSEPTAAWSAAYPELLRGAGTKSLPLSGLSVAAVAERLRSTADRADWAPYAEQLRLRSNGNPLYLSLLKSDPPGGNGALAVDQAVARRADLRALVLANVAALSPACRQALEAAAMLGERISTRLLAEVTETSVTQTSALVAEAISAGVLRISDDVPAFTHALVRDSVVADIALDRRAELHRACALALQAVSTDLPAGSIAEHWRLAAGSDAAGRCVFWSRRAAGLAAAGFDHDTAVAFAELALRQLQTLGLRTDGLAELTVELAERQMAAGHLRAAVDSCQSAADRAEKAGRADLLARAALVISGVGDTEAFRVVHGLNRRALAALPVTEAVLRARLLAQQAITAAETGGGYGAAELAAEAVVAAAESGDPTAELEALAARHLSITVLQTVDERERIARRAIDLGGIAAEPTAALWGYLWLIEVYFQRGELFRIDQELSEIELLAARRHVPLARWHSQRIRAAKAALRGDFELAYRINDESLVLAHRMDDISMVGGAHAFTVALSAVRGDPSRVGPEILEIFRHVPPLPLLRALLAVLLLVLDEKDEAATVLDELRFLIDGLPVGPRWAGTLAIIGIAATMLDDDDTAERVYQKLLPNAGYCDGDGSGTIFPAGSNAGPVGELALAAGRVDAAVGLFADAVIANKRIGARPFVALSRLGWARALHRRATDPELRALSSAGDLQLAADLSRQAAAEFRRLGMPGPLRTADQLLTTLAAHDRQRNPLTVREEEIARLIAQEMSNKEIAALLVVSERTVESHVRNILAKLDLTGRVEIARWTRRR